MSDYAKLEDDVVVNIVVADPDWVGLETGIWVEYSYQINPAMMGSRYNAETSMFEWFDETTQTWVVIYP